MHTTPPLSTHPMREYPPPVRDALARLVEALASLELVAVSLVVFGSLAKGTYRPGESDVNLAIVLDEATPRALRALTDCARAAQRAVRVSPFILERREIARLADVFPVKLADIARARHVLMGDDPFAAIAIDREHLRLRVEQALRNQLLRLRRQAVFAGDEPREIGRAIYGAASSLGVELGALLDVAGVERRAGLALGDVFRDAAAAFDLDRATLDALAEVMRGGAIADAPALLSGLLAVLARAVAVADSLEVAP